MKEKIHPQYFDDVQVACVCGEKFITGSIKKQIKIEICSKCHPFFTGQQKFLDSEGRVERFERKRKAGRPKKVKTLPLTSAEVQPEVKPLNN